jgi:hypothetical protein
VDRPIIEGGSLRLSGGAVDASATSTTASRWVGVGRSHAAPRRAWSGSSGAEVLAPAILREVHARSVLAAHENPRDGSTLRFGQRDRTGFQPLSEAFPAGRISRFCAHNCATGWLR